MVFECFDVEKIVYFVCLGLSEVDFLCIIEILNNIFGLIDQMQVVDISGVELFVYLLEVIQCLCLDVVIEIDYCDVYQIIVFVVEEGLYLVLKVIEL